MATAAMGPCWGERKLPGGMANLCFGVLGQPRGRLGAVTPGLWPRARIWEDVRILWVEDWCARPGDGRSWERYGWRGHASKEMSGFRAQPNSPRVQQVLKAAGEQMDRKALAVSGGLTVETLIARVAERFHLTASELK